MNYLIGLTKAQLETELRRAQNELLAGKTMTQSGAGDVNFAHSVQLQITERIKLILGRLSEIDPVAYPPGDSRPIDRTQIVAPYCL